MSFRLKFLVIILVGLVCYYFGQNVPMKEQLLLFGGLRNTAAIIFGVMGAWLAILHPSSLHKIFSKDKSSIAKEDRETIDLLLLPILISTFILLFVLIIPLFIAVGKTLPFLIQYTKIFRALSFSILGCLTVFQIWSLILTLVPSDILKTVIQKEEAKEKLKKKMFSLTRDNKL